MDQSKINRINELYKKQKSTGLTEEEKAEQAILRKEYIALFRGNFISTMQTISIQEPDGSITELSKKNVH